MGVHPVNFREQHWYVWAVGVGVTGDHPRCSVGDPSELARVLPLYYLKLVRAEHYEDFATMVILVEHRHWHWTAAMPLRHDQRR